MIETPEISNEAFREALGRVPTPVTIVTCESDDGQRHGMVVSSFTSLSLDPPLVTFMPAKTSTTYPRIQQSGRFCVNVLATDQAEVCRAFFTKDPDRFDRFGWTRGANGAPVLQDAIAVIECDHDATHDGGDHHIVVGRVTDLRARRDTSPLVSLSGGYGRFSGHSVAAWNEPCAVDQLRYVDFAHAQMQALSRAWTAEILALVRDDTDMMVLASTGSEYVTRLPTRVGLRLPIVAPMGALLVAWDDHRWIDWWLSTNPAIPASDRTLADKLDLVRSRGFSLVLSAPTEDFDSIVATRSVASVAEADALRTQVADTLDVDSWEPEIADLPAQVDVRTISAPVMASDGTLAFMLTVHGLGSTTREQLHKLSTEVKAVARSLTEGIAESFDTEGAHRVR